MISVIVPVYNAEKYLDKCIKSILNQTFKDFELILVDDGSTDNSGLICDDYANKDSRIRIIHRENGGPSIARNVAVLKAQGDKITFIDSDDYVTIDYLETLYSSFKQYNADISSVLMTEVGERMFQRKIINNREAIVMTGREALLDVLYQKHIDTTPCGMLFNREIVVNNPFPDGKYHEDDYTMFKYFECANTVVINKGIGYFYVQHASSIMHTNSDKILADELDAADHIVRYIAKKNDNELNRAADSKKFSDYCQVLIKYKNLKKNDIDSYKRIINYLDNVKKQILLDRNTRIKNKMAACLLYFGPVFFGKIGRLLS